MSALFPHPTYADIQPYHRTILTTHVLHRGFQAGSMLGALSGALYYTYVSRLRNPKPSPAPLSSLASTGIGAPASTGAAPKLLFTPTILRATATGGALGTALMALAIPMRMRGREEIEWRDRSWRLLENRGQMEVDSFSVAGAVCGALFMLRNTAGRSLGGRTGVVIGETAAAGPAAGLEGQAVRGGVLGRLKGLINGRAGMVLGGAGVGASVGVLVYLGWRYGMRGGKWVEAVEDGVESAGKGVGVVSR